MRIAAFDYDDTVIDGQSGALLGLYLFRKRMLSAPVAARLVWWGVCYKLHVPLNQLTSRELVFSALRNMGVEEVRGFLREFQRERLAKLVRPAARAEIARRRAEGMEAVLVSATFSSIAKRAAAQLGMDGFVATEMSVGPDGRYTGLVDGEVVEGAGKLTALTAWADARYGAGGWELACAYGDHYTDEALLARAEEAFAVRPDHALARIAKNRGWKILVW